MEAVTFNLDVKSCFFAVNIERCFLFDGKRLNKVFAITDQNIKLDSFCKDPLSEPLNNWGSYPRAQTSKCKKDRKTKSAKTKLKTVSVLTSKRLCPFGWFYCNYA